MVHSQPVKISVFNGHIPVAVKPLTMFVGIAADCQEVVTIPERSHMLMVVQGLLRIKTFVQTPQLF